MTVDANPGISFQHARTKFREIAENRNITRQELRAALIRRAEANHAVSKGMAVAFAKHRTARKPVEESKILAKADVADKQLEADMADVDVKTAQARLDELEGERSSLRMLADWTREES